jgi:hypothetical protein
MQLSLILQTSKFWFIDLFSEIDDIESLVELIG